MSINWGIVQSQAQLKAHQYAQSKLPIHQYSDAEAHIKNAYLAGYMESASERESLRAINERLEKAHANSATKEVSLSPIDRLEESLKSMSAGDLEGLI